jgi:hypothetical protein
MQTVTLSRRAIVQMTLAVLSACGLTGEGLAVAAPPELTVPRDAPEERFDFEAKGLEGWTTVNGQWTVEDSPEAASGKRVLVQRATKNEFNVIVAPPGPYTDLDVSMKFKPISGREDASGGLVFRFTDGSTTLSARMPWRTTSASTTTIAGAVSSRAPGSRRRRSVNGIRFASWRSATTSRHGSTGPSTSTTATPDSGQDAWDYGRRRTRSRRSMTS